MCMDVVVEPVMRHTHAARSTDRRGRGVSRRTDGRILLLLALPRALAITCCCARTVAQRNMFRVAAQALSVRRTRGRRRDGTTDVRDYGAPSFARSSWRIFIKHCSIIACFQRNAAPILHYNLPRARTNATKPRAYRAFHASLQPHCMPFARTANKRI